ncbi:MAG: (2Fe-2S)-binding protein [Anaerolineales bacterium]|nr:(2Fe-2S)-binding protein [Anaerolineales bacterium]
MPRFILDEQPIEFQTGESVLVAMLRAGEYPTVGGCLCLAGDCPHCLATVDGVSYTRTCQVAAQPGQMVQRHPASGEPPLPTAPAHNVEVAAQNFHCEAAVIGQGSAGQAAADEARAAGKSVITLDSKHGQEVIGIYLGPLVVARTAEGMWHIHAQEVVVATGAAELAPVAPGNELRGLLTARAATQLHAAGVNLGRVVAIGPPLENVPAEIAEGTLVRFEGDGKIQAVITQTAAGAERRYECDTVSIGLGLTPRDTLLRIGNGLNVRAVGEAAPSPSLPPCPAAGTVCHCSHVSVVDLEAAWERGFREMELMKRATLAGTGTCQGATCLPYLRSFLAQRGGTVQAPFTARPVTRQLTLGEAAAGAHHRATPRTALDEEHRKLGARMDRVGGWWRPWTYGNFLEEYWAVREAVSIGDVSTLGKMLVSGPDALELLERLYPTQVSTIKPGRSRYVLLLNERGYVLDDGLISRDSETRFALTFTSGGASMAEMWVRDWAESWGLDVRVLNQTMSLGAINVTGPLTPELLRRAGLAQPLQYMQHVQTEIAEVPCRVYRLSFTGEVAYELHHPSEHSAKLWRALLALGKDLGIRPHGIEALLKLRLEKGHIIVGQDTDFDSTPRRVNMEWAIKMAKEYFVGQQAILRTNKIPLDKQLVALEIAGPAPLEGEVLWHNGEYAGYVTSSFQSPALKKAVMLAWLKLFNEALPETVTVAGRPAHRVNAPFYDKEGHRARA